ncbi:MAG: superoxide dismutase, partial [Flavobacteriales bacterium]|nr:superoxide dismutase [Flavobacteriales bacterium]
MSFAQDWTVPELPYAYEALEPAIDAETMHIHHDKHHLAYVTNLNTAMKVEANQKYAKLNIEQLCAAVDPEDMAIRNNGGGHFNHTFFWNCLSAPSTAGEPSAALANAIQLDFGSMENLKKVMADEGKARFGSGWVWLCKDDEGGLFVTSTANQDNPFMSKVVDKPGTPILGIDVWEHAYYLKYQNKRADYLTAIFTIVNWSFVNE